VQIGLHDVQVDEIDTSGGSFDATFWIQLEWIDRRLEWDPRTYNETIERLPGTIWEPAIYIRNILTSQSSSQIYETPSSISRYIRRWPCTIQFRFRQHIVVMPMMTYDADDADDDDDDDK
jgi:hypothetical protein